MPRVLVEGRLASPLAALGRLARFCGATLRALPGVLTRRDRQRELVIQLDALGVGALPITHITGLIAGLLVGLQTKASLRQFGITSLFPQMLTLALVREVGPTFVALIAGGRAASGIASELATMSVTQQVDALRALRRNPVEQLAAPRTLACALTFPLLALAGVVAGLVGGMVIGLSYLHQGPTFFFHQAMQVLNLREVVPNLLVKPMAFGLLIGLVSSHLGLAAEGGTRAVGSATVRAVVNVTVGLLVLDYLVGEVFRRGWPPPPF